jgi:hypothetical protein
MAASDEGRRDQAGALPRVGEGRAAGGAKFRAACTASTGLGKTLISAPTRAHPRNVEMGRQLSVVLYVAAMAAVIVGVDFAFFRTRFWERLTVNIGIVLVFAAFYFRFLRHP